MDKNKHSSNSSIELLNFGNLNRMMDLVRIGVYSDTVFTRPQESDNEYLRICLRGSRLMQEILDEKKEMVDYITASLKRGYYHRTISKLFNIYKFSVDFPDENTVVLRSTGRVITYKDGLLRVINLPAFPSLN